MNSQAKTDPTLGGVSDDIIHRNHHPRRDLPCHASGNHWRSNLIINMQDIRQTREWGRFLASRGWIIKKIPKQDPRGEIFCFIKRIPLTPFGVMKVQRWRGKLDFNKLKRLKKKYGVIYTVLEPRGGEILLPGNRIWQYKLSKAPYLPSKTIIVDLRKSEAKLWKDLSENAKRILRISMGQPMGAKEIEPEIFWRAWKEAGRWRGLNKTDLYRLKNAFGKKCRLVVSKKNNRLLSGIVLLESKNTINYFQSWTNKEGRRVRSHYFLIWNEILRAKKRGLKYWDFEGIYDNRFPLKKWKGFSEFKKKFGGREVDWPGCFAKWF